jgi:tetratricopeptide (TPR) repeat protein
MKLRNSVHITLALALLFAAPLAADTLSLKQQAKNKYELKRYPRALVLARQATEANPNDAEAWFLRGWYSHYMCYDTRPLSGFSRATSDSTLSFFERAVQLDPKLGDAYYFIGAEYGGRFRDALCHGDAEQARAELRAARAKNAYPDWALEFCRNMLKSCAQNAVLFVDGDIIVNGISYVQLVEGYRLDVTAVYLWSLPRFALLFKEGIPGAITPAPISWTRDQIMDRQSYPWNGDTIRVPVRPEVLKKLGITARDESLETEMKFAVPGPWLNATTALLIDLLETNQWRRPVYLIPQVSNLVPNESCLQDCGLVSRLLPVNAVRYGLRTDTTTIKRVLLDSASYRDLATVKDHDMPRVSGVLFNYRAALAGLAIHYNESGDSTARNRVLDQMATLIPESIVPIPPEAAQFLKQLRKGGKSQ